MKTGLNAHFLEFMMDMEVQSAQNFFEIICINLWFEMKIFLKIRNKPFEMDLQLLRRNFWSFAT